MATSTCRACGEPFTYNDHSGQRIEPDECGACDTNRFDL